MYIFHLETVYATYVTLFVYKN